MPDDKLIRNELVSDCSTILQWLEGLGHESPWYRPPNGIGHQVSRRLESLDTTAAEIEGIPPDLPSLSELFVCGMTTSRGIGIARQYVRRLRNWAGNTSTGNQETEVIEDLPAEYRENEKPDGEPMCLPYLEKRYGLQSHQLSRAWERGILKDRVKQGRAYCYPWRDILALCERREE